MGSTFPTAAKCNGFILSPAHNKLLLKMTGELNGVRKPYAFFFFYKFWGNGEVPGG